MAKTLDEAGVKRLIQEIKGANKNLNTPLVIKTSNSVADKAANKQAIADYIEKAKAAGIADVNGMGVTILINDTDFSSGVGYLYKYDNDDNFIYIFGLSFIDFSDVEFKDEACVFAVSSAGQYFQTQLITVLSESEVTSDMLVKGARKPIILTPETTEVDEETYQKLLSDDVDVVFKTFEDNICILTYKTDRETSYALYFTCFSVEGESDNDNVYLYGYEVTITKNSPHTCNVIENFSNDFSSFLTQAGFLRKSNLSPILRQIVIRGEAADIKASIQAFEKRWVDLAGDSTLSGARFIGQLNSTEQILMIRGNNGTYRGISPYNYGDTAGVTNGYLCVVVVDTDGNVSYRNIDVDLPSINLDSDTTLTNIGHSYPYKNCTFTYGSYKGSGIAWASSQYGYLEGITFDGQYKVSAESQGTAKATVTLTPIGAQKLLQPILQEIDLTGTDAERKAKLDQFETDWKAFTGSETLMGARFVGKFKYNNKTVYCLFTYDVGMKYGGVFTFNDGDDNFLTYMAVIEGDPILVPIHITPATDYSHLEAITIYTDNTAEHMQANLNNIAAYEANLRALGVDTTKGYMIPVKLDSGSLDGFVSYHSDTADYPWSGLLVRPGGTGKFIGINKDGFAVLIPDILTRGEQTDLTTSSKQIVGAINEVNTLAKGVNAFGAIELKANDNTANKAAITAYLKILTDAGVSTTNGYAVPVRITGNSQEYHGILNIGTGVLLSGVVTDVNENHHYPFNVSTTDGVITFNESNYFLEKTSNEVTEMLDAIKYSYTSVPFTDTTLSNKAQLEVFLSKVPDATVMHCTYNEIWAGTLHKINGDWYGLLVKNTNSPADNINVKLSADGTIIKSNSAQ